jgi:glucose/arabinose dehydrogenase
MWRHSASLMAGLFASVVVACSGNDKAPARDGSGEGGGAGSDGQPIVDARAEVAVGTDEAIDGPPDIGGATDTPRGQPDTAGSGPDTTSNGSDAPSSPACGIKLALVGMIPGHPIFLTQPPNEPRIFVVQRVGGIMALRNGVFTPFFNITPSVAFLKEGGLLSAAFHPQYAQNGRFFVFYTRTAEDPYSQGGVGDIVIAEGKRGSTNPDLAEAAVKPLVTIPHPRFENHMGGTLAFGPDGMLWASVGDGGGTDDPYKSGQNLGNKLAKILRIDVDNPGARPPGNVTTPGADPHVWDWGLRNPYRFSFDRLTGDLYIGDVGHNLWEEINFEPKGQGNRNYGWPVMEGAHCLMPESNCDQTGKVPPLLEYDHSGNDLLEKRRAVIGGYVYRGRNIPCLTGRYLYAEHEKGQVLSLRVVQHKATELTDLTSELATSEASVRHPMSFGEDSQGELYLFQFGDERIFRIDAD